MPAFKAMLFPPSPQTTRSRKRADEDVPKSENAYAALPASPLLDQHAPASPAMSVTSSTSSHGHGHCCGCCGGQCNATPPTRSSAVFSIGDEGEDNMGYRDEEANVDISPSLKSTPTFESTIAVRRGSGHLIGHGLGLGLGLGQPCRHGHSSQVRATPDDEKYNMDDYKEMQRMPTSNTPKRPWTRSSCRRIMVPLVLLGAISLIIVGFTSTSETRLKASSIAQDTLQNVKQTSNDAWEAFVSPWKSHEDIDASLDELASLPLSTSEAQTSSTPLPGPVSSRLSVASVSSASSSAQPTHTPSPVQTRLAKSIEEHGSYWDTLEPARLERYVTAIPLGGTNNQLKGIFNLLYLGIKSARTVILPPIAPNLHLNTFSGPPYSAFYDLEHLQSRLNLSVIEWADLKSDLTPFGDNPVDPTQPIEDQGPILNKPDRNHAEAWYGPGPITKEYFINGWRNDSEELKCYYSAAVGLPKTEPKAKLLKDDSFGRGYLVKTNATYHPADTGINHGRFESMDKAVEILKYDREHIDGNQKDLTCLTQSYWLEQTPRIGSAQAFDDIGQHLTFNRPFTALAESIIATVLGVSANDIHRNRISYITAHIRRNDVADKCDPRPEGVEMPSYRTATPYNADMTTDYQDDDQGSAQNKLEARDDIFDDAIDMVQGRLVKRKQAWYKCVVNNDKVINRINGIRVQMLKDAGTTVYTTRDVEAIPVVFTTDDRDPKTREELASQPGFHFVDHEKLQTAQKYGAWYPPMLDAAILTRGTVYIGTSVSTMSQLAGRRKVAWHGGASHWF
ncbi:uncharacterized protein L969DRAFT_95099 [Mixia osmundae IAM 14324]|uniref:O-fucosyltransferase family protein n=1 Tax=Mixia osmundae (strain CBS 9802 / IAM 14324 / JCM 22182 / KY 12970) TaxID=764103 RepID=G7E766_MIXOS|nr:uncharacterized protein L969DRAFT_95099 [Mixia osmundae IAM 14324]KEI38938.1 hypothetical protein L969DRAFT_95099 [Mixia osmundae IAM 14324]GAA98676.1 hypothetical protein E5Q_05364 [Mixia osmundae IAM 14324]